MAAVDSSQITIERSWTEGGVTGKQRIGMVVSAELSSQGGSTNTFPVTALGLTKAESIQSAVVENGGPQFYFLAISQDGTLIYTIDPAAVSTPFEAADISSTIRFEIHGY